MIESVLMWYAAVFVLINFIATIGANELNGEARIFAMAIQSPVFVYIGMQVFRSFS